MAKKTYFYGIYGIRYIDHGNWADPELIWHNKSFNYYDLEDPLWETYQEEIKEDLTNLDFDIWVKKSAYLAREYLQDLLENKCFYGM